MHTEDSSLPAVTDSPALDIEELYSLYGNDVLRICTVYLGKQSLAEDAFQDVFVKVVRKAHTYRQDTPVKYWLLAIARNVCRDYLRSAWMTKVVSFEAWRENKSADVEPPRRKTPVAPREEERMVNRLDSHSTSPLMEAVCKMPAKYKDVVMLKYYYDLSNEEIASTLRITEGAVRTRLFRARKVLAPFTEGEE